MAPHQRARFAGSFQRRSGRESDSGASAGQLGDEVIVGGSDGTVAGADADEGGSGALAGSTRLPRRPVEMPGGGAARLGIVAANLARS
jgi:hypothetical protein